jgi:hypothetical protein
MIVKTLQKDDNKDDDDDDDYYYYYYLLTPWSRVLLEKLTVNFAASEEIPRIYGTRQFLTVPTSGYYYYYYYYYYYPRYLLYAGYLHLHS